MRSTRHAFLPYTHLCSNLRYAESADGMRAADRIQELKYMNALSIHRDAYAVR